MLKKVLIANRGEIACRIARTCRRLGIGVATIHSSADRSARHVREIGESIEVGGAPAAESYLNIDAVLAAAQRVGADAVHPGYGFLAENAAFARAVEGAGLVFIGPDAATIERIGGKASAKREAARVGLPVIDGTDQGLSDPAAIAARIRDMPLPVLLKAVAGGGGRGMAVIGRADDIEARIESAMREAAQSFGSGELIVERYLPNVRHIEVQIAGDGRGAAIHLFERECTLQRRHQKLIEEAPAANLPAALLEAMRADACRLAAAVGYRNLGTVEFIVADGRHHFLEVNPRLQVEHPVTEAVTGLDLVELQLRIAADGRLPLAQADVRCSGHAFEARLCAEDPAAGFLPATGRIAFARFPEAPVRVEAGVASGDVVTPHYDSMVAKLITSAATRDAALRDLQAALDATTVLGVVTNLPLLKELVALPETRAATFHTRLVDERQAARDADATAPSFELLVAAALHWLAHERAALRAGDLGCWTDDRRFTGWRLGAAAESEPPALPALLLTEAGREWAVRFGRRDEAGWVRVAIGDRSERAKLEPIVVQSGRRDVRSTEDDQMTGDAFSGACAASPAAVRCLLHCAGRTRDLTIALDGTALEVASRSESAAFATLPYLGGVSALAAASGALTAPMMGKVVAIRAGAGDRVAAGQIVIVLESMKMELHVIAPFDAVVQAVRCRLGDMVERGAVLAEVGAAPPADHKE
jgi:3-methylcrotonyl-CoA carboxylase alpha subunit